MGQVISGWSAVTEQSLTYLFNGSDSSIDQLGTIISNGKLIEGSVNSSPASPPVPPVPRSLSSLQASIAKAFFGYSIPAIWTVSGAYPFIIDSGYDCSADNPITQYMDPDTQRSTYACYNNKLYYLGSPSGNPQNCFEGGCIDNTFSAPPGLSWLDGTSFGGIRLSDLIIG
jgi:hypothetical protein